MPHGPGGALGTTVKYLPQKFVDQLCDGDVLSDDLQREVENVIFRHLDGDAQMGCEDFTELRDFRTAGIRDSRQDLKTQIRVASQDTADLIERQAAFYFSSEPLLMTVEYVEPWPFYADTVQVMCCTSGQVSILLPGNGQNCSFKGGRWSDQRRKGRQRMAHADLRLRSEMRFR